ncbi:MAG TPA: ABC transporter permease, partial [Bryobacteraceae bacterium]
MLQDFRFAVRMLMKQPGFSLIAVLTLTLGIGATSAVFSMIQGVLLTPPPYREPQRLALITSARTDGQRTTSPRGWATAQWSEWAKDSKSFESIAGYAWTFNFLVSNDGSESLEGMVVSKDYFRVTGLEPLLGRTFTESETGSPPAPVILIGYDLWQRKFNGDPLIVGKTLHMSRRDTPPTIVGVMRPGVRFLPSPGQAQEPNYNVNGQVDFWMPGASSPQRLKQPDWDIVGRLRNGVTPRQAQSDLGIVAARQAQAEHEFEGFTPQV